MGVVYTIQKCAFYIMGARKLFTVMTDHKPLLGEFNKPLSETPNPRLQRLHLKVVVAKVQLTCEGGKHNLIADALSRAPVSAAAPLDAGEQQEEAVFVRALTEGDVEAVLYFTMIPPFSPIYVIPARWLSREVPRDNSCKRRGIKH